MKKISLMLCSLFVLGAFAFVGCKDDHCRPRNPECDTKVIYQGNHFCSGVKLQKTDGTWLRAFGMKSESYKPGQTISISYKPYKMENDCQTFAALPPEDLGEPVEITCESGVVKSMNR